MAFEWTAKLGELIKLKMRYWVATWVVLAAILAMPNSVGRWVGTTELLGRRYYGFAFVIITIYLLANVGAHLVDGARRKSRRKSIEKRGIERLQKLSPEETQVLCQYICQESRTQTFDGVVGGLLSDGILYQATNFGRLSGPAFNISDWVWDYLHKPGNEALILEGVPRDQNGHILSYASAGAGYY